MLLNLQFAWCWFLAGVLTGTIQGLWFHRADWMGGYDSWRRRLMRLGHVAFFGTGLLNLCFYLSVETTEVMAALVPPAGILLAIGGLTMPIVCYLAAWRERLRWFFPLPVVTLVLGVALAAAAFLIAGAE